MLEIEQDLESFCKCGDITLNLNHIETIGLKNKTRKDIENLVSVKDSISDEDVMHYLTIGNLCKMELDAICRTPTATLLALLDNF
ncbi:hypothetical protein [Methanolapillus millepedarum]|uniref:Uncharacterized protein n=1 Tax=Methanolapillus millepedarum TaxID=3028296 RepID=A0AA96V3T9_9EURY|nr:hypothetical protein MsAc7_00050 [Methanosarcinaceae archaeon Ac7]